MRVERSEPAVQKYGERWTEEELVDKGSEEVLGMLREVLTSPQFVNGIGDIAELLARIEVEEGASR